MKEIEIDKLRCVLVIDDNPAIHEDFRKILCPSATSEDLVDAASAFFGDTTPQTNADLNASVHTAIQGEDGFKLVKQSVADGQPYAMAFVDMRMPPGWDGLTTIEQLWKVDPDLQIVICSAYSDNSWTEIQERLGQTDRLLILKKPFDNAEVLQLTMTLIEKRHLSRLATLNTLQLEKLVEERTRHCEKAQQDGENLIAAIDSILVELDENGEIVRWNRNAAESFELTFEEVVGKKFDDLAVRWDEGCDVSSIVRGKTARAELTFEDHGGMKRFVGFSSYPIREDGNINGMLLLGTDLTEHRALESQLHQAQKLESVGQLAAGVAHEINTPMQYVGDNLDFLERKLNRLDTMFDVVTRMLGEDTDQSELLLELADASKKLKAKSFLGDVLEAITDSKDGVHHVSRIVRAMKEFAHPGQEEKIPVDINHALQSTVAVATNEWKYVADVKTFFDESIPRVTAFPVELNQVFLNILVNAAHAIGDATDAGANGKGTITITTKAVEDSVEVKFSDSGTGIPEHVKKRIFDPFFTTKEIGKGTGQGLSIAHAVIVSKHGGRLWCESKPGEGTTFFIQIPVEETSTSELDDTLSLTNA